MSEIKVKTDNNHTYIVTNRKQGKSSSISLTELDLHIFVFGMNQEIKFRYKDKSVLFDAPSIGKMKVKSCNIDSDKIEYNEEDLLTRVTMGDIIISTSSWPFYEHSDNFTFFILNGTYQDVITVSFLDIYK